MSTQKRILIICRKPPYGSSLAREGLDIALASSVFDQQLAILFTGEGVWQLLKEQQGDRIQQKNYDTMLSAFPLYDITELYVDETSLLERGLSVKDFAIPVKCLSQQDTESFFSNHDVHLSF